MKRIIITLLFAALALGVLAGPAGASSLGTIKRDTSTLIADLTAVSDAASAYDTTTLQDACSTLGDDIAVAQTRNRPRNYRKVAWTSYQLALSAYADSATSCEAGDYSAATASITEATGYLKTATRLLKGA